jgi:hypothetical protein
MKRNKGLNIRNDEGMMKERELLERIELRVFKRKK